MSDKILGGCLRRWTRVAALVETALPRIDRHLEPCVSSGSSSCTSGVRRQEVGAGYFDLLPMWYTSLACFSWA